jgi:anti-sigma factor RsiW
MKPGENQRCKKILELLPRFIENAFTPEQSAQIGEHLGSCPTCQAEYESMRRLVDALETLPSIGVPESFKDAVMKHLPPPKDKPPK